MPSIAVHLTLAVKAEEILGIKDLPQYYLGNIAPDAVNVGGFAAAAVRYGAHLRSRSYSEWKENIARYRIQHSAEAALNPDFFTGVLLHLYTDIAWDEAVQPLLFDDLRRRGFRESELNDRKWDELRGFDSVLGQKPPYKRAVSYLAKAEAHAVTTVTADQLALWRDKIAALEYPYPPAQFLTEEHIDIALKGALELLG